ncbi:hypothetical protein [Haliea sp. E17]|uniref:hypothetical protein n=1 Tax=Haliea sp. E17 TaxID=3401576 RepID=UPI003AACA41A
MKLDNAIDLGAQGAWKEAQVMVNPSLPTEWFVMLRDAHYKSFILADNDDSPISTDDLNALAQLIRAIGLKDFTVIF